MLRKKSYKYYMDSESETCESGKPYILHLKAGVGSIFKGVNVIWKALLKNGAYFWKCTFSKASCPRQSLWEGPWALSMLQEDGAWPDLCSEMQHATFWDKLAFWHSHRKKRSELGQKHAKLQKAALFWTVFQNVAFCSILHLFLISYVCFSCP